MGIEQEPSRAEELKEIEQKVAEEAVESSDEVAAYRHAKALETHPASMERYSEDFHKRSEQITKLIDMLRSDDFIRVIDYDWLGTEERQDYPELYSAMRDSYAAFGTFREAMERVKSECDQAVKKEEDAAKALREESPNAEWQSVPAEEIETTPAEPKSEE